MLGLLNKLKEGRDSNSLPLHPRYWFGELETRWIAVFRILFAILLLKDAVYHVFLAKVFYSDTGAVPRGAFFSGMSREIRFSLMDSIASEQGAILFFIVWIIVLIALMLGYRVRLMSILNYILILSIHERNPFVLTGADTAMRTLSFWLMFAPIGQHYSLDALRRKAMGLAEETSAFALPIRLMQWQLIMIYLCTAYLKTIGPIWTSGEAMFYVLQLDTFVLPLGIAMRDLPLGILSLLSLGALISELLIPLLLLFPLYWRWTRLTAFFLALGLHGGIALVLTIPDFSVVMLLAYLLFFDPDWLVWLERRLEGQFARIEAFFTRILPYVYPEHWKPIPRQPVHARLLALFLIPVFLLVIWWNALQVSYYNDDSYVVTAYPYSLQYPPAPFDKVLRDGENLLRFIGLWQYWDLFSPLPLQYDGYLVIKGEFEDGSFLDLLSGFPLDANGTFIDPVTSLPLAEGHVNRWYWGPPMRYEKWEENIYLVRNERLMASWSNYFCRSYETRPFGERLARLEIQYHRTNAHLPDMEANPPFIDTVWYHWCFDEYAPQG